MLDELDDKRLIFVTGKGGVGKSTVVAALGRAFANRGDQTLVAEMDAYSAMEELLDVELTDHAISAVDPPLHAVNLTASEALVDAISRFVPSRRVVKTVLGNQVARVFFDAAPGVNQFALLDQVRVLLDRSDGDEPRWDRIIVDLPAAGHAVTFLSVPQTFQKLIQVGAIADTSEQLADLVTSDRRTAVTAVCLPESMPVNETVDLERELESTLGRGLDVGFANMVHQLPFDEEHVDQFDGLVDGLDRKQLVADILTHRDGSDRAVQRLVAGNVMAMDWFRRDARYVDELQDRLTAPVTEIPVFYETDGDTIVSRVADYLDGGAPPEGSNPDIAS